MKNLITSVCVFLWGATISYSQISLGENNALLHTNDKGNFFSLNSSSSHAYEVPKGDSTHILFTGAYWFGALNSNNQLQMAAQKFETSGNDFYAGPYSSNDAYNDANYQQKFLPAYWKVSQTEIEDHISEYNTNGSVNNPAQSILTWPAHGDSTSGTAANLAPFVDINNDGVYDPYAGDYPQIKGCEAIYIIMNDDAGPSNGTSTPSMQIEVHTLLYQYASNDFLNDVTFMESQIYNRGSNTLYDFTSAFYADFDLGSYTDDYIGSNEDLNMMYVYNGDNFDQLNTNGIKGYGDNPPAAGIMYLNQSMFSSGYFTNSAPPSMADPTQGHEYWSYMHGIWADGTPWVKGGTGYPGSPGATNIQTNYLFSGNPSDPANISWSEYGYGTVPGDRRAFYSSKQGDLSPGESYEIDQAIIYARGSNLNHLENVNHLFSIADSVKSFYQSGQHPCDSPSANLTSLNIDQITVFPNPSSGEFTLRIPSEEVFDLRITDAFGRTIYSQKKIKNEVNISNLNKSGIYFITIEINGQNITKKHIVE